ncbi:hypothetical protein O181_058136 [Austropuccinia psidii MF-1]|uniref:Retrotransposon gag domain-containing protein n=1 Tax=Austropuccinia psidii MF-1 TaxID=1389203 RepID=A0A9Q3EGG4_9BASI|nr:hypothetical protein [Austropuccinia psidii MF-1]
MKAPEGFDGNQPFKVRSFIHYCQLTFHNDPETFSQDRKKGLYATSFLVGRAAEWIETYLSNITNQESSYLLNSWPLFESQLLTLFGDPNEVREAEGELDGLRMKEGGHVALYIADLRSLVSRIGDWVKGPLFIISGRVWPSGVWINWPSILQTLILFKTYWMSSWNLIPGTMRGKRRRIIIKRRIVKPQSQTLLIIKITQAQVIKRRISILKSGRSPILVSL